MIDLLIYTAVIYFILDVVGTLSGVIRKPS